MLTTRKSVMKTIIITILAGAGVCFFFSCSSQTSDPEVLAQEKFQIYQVPGCVEIGTKYDH
jgi:4-diphosphocytidyl-2C-methyl-D-erythritol kinase